nr:Uncharacterised protein [Klebsiella pneumoniae]
MMFRGILITQDNADKVEISTLSPEFGWLRPAGRRGEHYV